MAKALFEERSTPEGMDLGNGRRIVEGPMPEETQYEHSLRSFGTPRRVSVYDKNAQESFGGPYLREDVSGEKGLVGYADIYREPEHVSALMGQQPTGRRIVRFVNDTNVGYMTVANKYRGGGIGRQMFDYIVNTTEPHNTIDLGRVVDASVGHMWEKHKEQGKVPHMVGKKWW